MQAEQKRAFEKHYGVREWRGQSEHGKLTIRGFTFEQWALPQWTAERVLRDEEPKLTTIRSIWSQGESRSKMLAVDVFACSSVEAAHDQLLETLGNIQSAAIERRSGKDAPGDVAFGLDDTMILFARANLVVLIRNAGRTLVSVREIARQFDKFLLRHLEPKRSGKEKRRE